MENFLKMVNIQSVLFIYMIVGYFCRKGGIFTNEARSKLTDFAVIVTLPCMIFKSFDIDFSWTALMQAGLALMIATAMAFLALLLGKFIYRKVPHAERCVMQYGTLVTNSGFVGLPLITNAFGDEGLFLASMYIIPNRVLMWSAGLSLFTTGTSARERAKKVLCNSAMIAAMIGMVWMVLPFSLPYFLDTAIDNLGDCTSPLAMALIGAILADIDFRDVWDIKAFYLVLVRQILLPVICLVTLKSLNLDPLTVGVSVTLSSMPIGSMTAILSQKYGANAQFASKCVFVSTLASLITVPVLTFFI